LQAQSDVQPPSPIERLYEIHEVANFLKISTDTARRLFRNEPGVWVMESTPCKYKRRYVTVRVPESVLLRVYRRHLNVAA
jgi:hypothetical protein